MRGCARRGGKGAARTPRGARRENVAATAWWWETERGGEEEEEKREVGETRRDPVRGCV